MFYGMIISAATAYWLFLMLPWILAAFCSFLFFGALVCIFEGIRELISDRMNGGTQFDWEV